MIATRSTLLAPRVRVCIRDVTVVVCKRLIVLSTEGTTERSSVGSRERTIKEVQRRAAMDSAKSLDIVFTAYEDELARVEVFKYLGCLMAMDDTDTQAIRANLKKSRKVWKMLSRLLRGENMEPRVCGMFYKAVVQAVLLFGSETWVLTDSAMRVLEGFHLRLAYRMARKYKPTKDPETSVWTYPPSEKVLEEVGLYTIREYIVKRRQTIAAYIVDRPILCVDESRRRGTSSRHLWWWEQTMDLDLARLAIANVVADEDEG